MMRVDTLDLQSYSYFTCRIPSSSKQDHFHKFSSTPTENQFPLVYDNIPRKDLSEEAAVNGSGGSLLMDQHRFEDSDSETTIHEYTNEENSFASSTEEGDEQQLEEEATDSSIVDVSKGFLFFVHHRLGIPLFQENNTHTKCYNESIVSNDVDILKYLPINILRSVHQTLKSQSTSSEGKLLFLKTFEQTLVTEIESRLAQTLKGGRQKRGTEHHDVGYDSHDNATGFPSIEGALMAISFLTFAVYLVRLVMLLFRNMNNPAPTPTGATLLLGRRKRSINILDEETVKILSSMDRFV
ncbi:LOW QUALITY PROTEIN: uncharacterized protein LOC143217470 [Lasioglossum baleicum]|uniref:LOW QUALITY PROTEIN: uncharacterized protein LOC143217470 n=1 Tax=Lasioglossum baleicum TaxID=434251 RepID=UPI003FCE2E2E